jgi:hypothetical protein
MHRDTGHEIRSELAWCELAGTGELTGVRSDRALDCLLRCYLGELLCYQVVILSELLQQVVARRQCRIHLLRDGRLLRPCADGLSGSIGRPAETIYRGGLQCRELLRRQLVRQQLLDRLLLQGCLLQSLLLHGMLPVRPLRQTLGERRRLLRITVQRVREGKIARVTLEGLWAEGSLGMEAALWIVREGLRTESSLGIKITLWIKHINLRLRLDYLGCLPGGRHNVSHRLRNAVDDRPWKEIRSGRGVRT